MIQTGIFTGYYPYGLVETARKIRAHGFNTVQLDLSFKDMDLSTSAISGETCRMIAATFRDHNLPICAISGYTNLIDPDLDARRAKLDHLKAIIRHARDMGSPYVISETGTYNTESDWQDDPRNHSEEGYAICRDVIADLSQTAYDHGAVFCLETYVNNVIGSVEETQRLFADVASPGLGLLMDPTNYFEAHNIDDMDATLDHIFDALDPHIRIAHAKDVKRSGEDKSEKHADFDAPTEGHSFRGVGEIELPAPGLGSLNYDRYLARLARNHPNIPIIIEHLEEDDIPRAKTFLDGKLRALGV
jgi:sugar phosphate isomerase/epimerase